MAKWIGLAAVVALTVAANVILKLHSPNMIRNPTDSSTDLFTQLLRQWPLVMAVGCYGVSFIIYGYVLRAIDLSVAYPVFSSVTLVLLAVIGVAALNEPFSMTKVVGAALIVVGVVLLARTQQPDAAPPTVGAETEAVAPQSDPG